MSNKKKNFEESDWSDWSDNSDWSEFAQSLEKNHNCSKCKCNISLIEHNMKTLSCYHNYCIKCYDDDKFTFCTVCSIQVKKEKKIKPTIQQIKLPINPTIPQINPNQQFRPTINPTINPSRISAPGINVYSFALNPLDHQPTGTMNLSRLDNVTFNLNLNNSLDPTLNPTLDPTLGPSNYGRRIVVMEEPEESDMINLANQRMVSELKRLTGNDQLFARKT